MNTEQTSKNIFMYIIIILNILTFISFALFGAHIFEQNLSSSGFKSIRKSLIIYGSLFNDTHLVAKDLLKLNNTTNTCLI